MQGKGYNRKKEGKREHKKLINRKKEREKKRKKININIEMIFFSCFSLADLTSTLRTKSYTLQTNHQNGNSQNRKREKQTLL